MSFKHNMVLIQVPVLVNDLVKEAGINVDDISCEELLTMACASWVMDIDKAKQYTYAAAVVQGKIKAVFDVTLWSSWTTDERVRFIGNCNQQLTRQYRHKDVSDLVGQNPIRYVDVFQTA
ncbi:MAG: hypothetical protein IKZ88_03030 [Neisseriaceae bacterium]|nr:hypothetical protein [Neisseriaceae bacterium]